MDPSREQCRPDTAWISVGLASSFPNLVDDGNVSQSRRCGAGYRPGCKVFHHGAEVPEESWNGVDLQDQVLVFQYRGKFHAMDHVRTPLAFLRLSTCDEEGKN